MAITIEKFMKAVQYKITEGSAYCWQCYGPNAYSLEHWNQKYDDGISTNIIFDTITHVVYEMQAWDYSTHREYRWINPDYLEAHKDEASLRNIDFKESIDGNKFIDLEVEDDILKKATAIVAGEPYDARVTIVLELEEELLNKMMFLAHEADVTLNQYVEKILRSFIEKAGWDGEWA